MHNDRLSRSVDFFWSTVSNLLANLVVLGLGVVITPIGLIISTYFQLISPMIALGIMGAGWLSTSVFLGVFYVRRRDDYKSRVVKVARRMFISDRLLLRLVASDSIAKPPASDIHNEIERLLEHLLTVLVGRLDLSEKAASFLVLQADGSFQVYSQAGHDGARYSREVRPLNRSSSMAGQSLDQGTCLVLRDSTSAADRQSRSIFWQPLNNDRLFRGRAMAPIISLNPHNPGKEIGVLCFDLKRPWLLNVEDQEVLLIYADKIGMLWELCQ